MISKSSKINWQKEKLNYKLNNNNHYNNNNLRIHSKIFSKKINNPNKNLASRTNKIITNYNKSKTIHNFNKKR